MAATWVVVPALEALRAELNDVAPDRDKSSDGSIGDQSHASGVSGHNPDETGRPEDYDADSINEVRARDFDRDLNRPGLTMEMVVQHLVQECRAGRITWIKYLIFNGRIWSANDGFRTRVYTGSNKHDHHAHISCKPDTASESTTRPVGLATLVQPAGRKDNTMPTADEIQAAVWGNGGAQQLLHRVEAIVSQRPTITLPGGRTEPNALAAALRDAAARDKLVLAALQAINASGGPDAGPIVAAVNAARDELRAAYTAEAAGVRGELDETQTTIADLGALIRQGLSGERDADAVLDELARRLAPDRT